MKIWTWNVNGIRNKVSLVNDLLKKHDIDILLITETKIRNKDTNILFEGYKCIFNCNKNSYYHGICFIYKNHLNIELISTTLPSYQIHEPTESKNKLIIHKYKDHIKGEIEKAHNTEGRILTIKCNDLIIVGTYVPNSGVHRTEPLKRLAYRTLAWDKDLEKYLNSFEKVIWLGDLNVTLCDNDLLNVKCNIAGTTPEERNNLKEFMKNWYDTYDINNIDKCQLRATWGVGGRFPLRLDYVICSLNLKSQIVSCINDQSFLGSDHCPIGVTIKL